MQILRQFLNCWRQPETAACLRTPLLLCVYRRKTTHEVYAGPTAKDPKRLISASEAPSPKLPDRFTNDNQQYQTGFEHP